RAPLVFGGLLILLLGLLGRSLYLQRIDNDFLQEQGSSRYSREIDVPAHRGRIVDRFGDPVASSSPVQAVWAWPEQVVATPDQLRALAAALEMTPAALNQNLAQGGDFVYVKKPVAPEVADRAAALKIKGVHDENEYWRYYPGGEVMSHVVGFTGDHDVGQEGLELAQQSWLGGKRGSRRVIINRRARRRQGSSGFDHRHRAGHPHDRPRHHPRCTPRRSADRRAGHPEIVERRGREDCAVAAGRDDVADAFRNRLRRHAYDRFSGRSLGPIAAGQELASDRAGDHGLRTRHFGQPASTGASVHGVRNRR